MNQKKLQEALVIHCERLKKEHRNHFKTKIFKNTQEMSSLDNNLIAEKQPIRIIRVSNSSIIRTSIIRCLIYVL